MITTNVQIIEELQSFLIQADAEKSKYTTHAGAFSKPKKLTFIAVILFLINMPRKSLGIELEHFFDVLDKGDLTPTKSALSQARYKLKPDFFIEWNELLQSSYYKGNDEGIKKWDNYILHGVDGTTFHLMNTEGIGEAFGYHSNQFGQVPMARVLMRYDLLNEIIINGQLAPIKTSENELGLKDLDEVADNVISIYDRNFISFTFIYEHERRNLNYIMRAPVGFNNEIKKFVASEETSVIEKFHPSTRAIKTLKERGIKLPQDLHVQVRLIRVELNTGEIEVLVSCLKDEEKFPSKDFQELYNFRWGSETCYDVVKNKFQITAFSGHTPKAIEQDFQATIFVANLNSVLIQQCEEQVKHKTQDREHEYKINRNISIGLMKNDIVRLFILNPSKVQSLLNKLETRFLRHLEPRRPGRTFVRSKKQRAIKSKYYTLTNYRRAI